MVKKEIKKHNFLNGNPISEDDTLIFGNIIAEPGSVFTIIGENQRFIPQLTLNDEAGNNIFRVNEESITYYDQSLVTENRLLEMVQEIIDEYLGRE